MKRQLLSIFILLYSLHGFSQLAVEGFENSTGPDPLPSTNWTLGTGNWSVFDNGIGITQRWTYNNYPIYVYEGAKAAYINRENIGAGNTSEDYLATPLINVPTNGQLHFFTRTFTTGDQGTLYRVMIAPANLSGNQTNPAAYSLVSQWTETTLNSAYNVYEEKTVDLSAFAGQGVYIAFVMSYTQTGVATGDRWLIDDVSVSEDETCYPTNLSATYNSATSLYLNWNYQDTPSSSEVMILPCNAPAPLPTDAGVVVTSTNYLFTSLLPDTCYKAYVKGNCANSTWHQASTTAEHNGSFYLIAFIDDNNNGIMDATEHNFHYGNFSVITNNTGPATYVSSSNNYTLFTSTYSTSLYDFGYQIDPVYAAYYSLGSFTYDDIPSPLATQTIYVPIIPLQPFYDFGISLWSYSSPIAGTTPTDHLFLESHEGDTPASGTITYTQASNAPVVSVSPSTNITYTPTGFTYTFTDLTPNIPGFLYIQTSIPPIPTVNIGDILTSSVTVSTDGIDVIPSNNTATLSQTVVASHDPNEVVESHGNQILFNQFSQNDYLYYTIHFQNTGTANAIEVLVNDVLDAKIDESSISMVTARHNYTMTRINNSITWEFDNIQLPPASTDEDLSNGFITFKAKLKPGFAVGDIIPATASIYFDTNPAIVTTPFNTEFVDALGTSSFNAAAIRLYPNPASNFITITNADTTENISNITIYDFLGKIIYSDTPTTAETSIDVSHFAKGIYLVELVSDTSIKITKKLILK